MITVSGKAWYTIFFKRKKNYNVQLSKIIEDLGLHTSVVKVPVFQRQLNEVHFPVQSNKLEKSALCHVLQSEAELLFDLGDIQKCTFAVPGGLAQQWPAQPKLGRPMPWCETHHVLSSVSQLSKYYWFSSCLLMPPISGKGTWLNSLCLTYGHVSWLSELWQQLGIPIMISYKIKHSLLEYTKSLHFSESTGLIQHAAWVYKSLREWLPHQWLYFSNWSSVFLITCQLCSFPSLEHF